MIKISKILFTFLFLAIFCSWGNFAWAQSNDSLVVEFESNPLFQDANFLPGTVINRFVNVTNNSAETQKIAVEAINIVNPIVEGSERFGDGLNLKILEGNIVHFDNNLTNFFDNGEIYLSDLAPQESAKYDFLIEFLSESDDRYQEKILNFDIIIGFQGQEGGSSSSSGGGTGGGVPRGLTILYPNIIQITDTSATVTWLTSYNSTSNVIYDTVSGKFDLSSPLNFGYDYLKEGDNIFGSGKGTGHTVTVVGLMPGTTYYYRAVSYASPPTITREYKFTTLAAKTSVTFGGNKSPKNEDLPVGGEDKNTPEQENKALENEILPDIKNDKILKQKNDNLSGSENVETEKRLPADTDVLQTEENKIIENIKKAVGEVLGVKESLQNNGENTQNNNLQEQKKDKNSYIWLWLLLLLTAICIYVYYNIINKNQK